MNVNKTFRVQDQVQMCASGLPSDLLDKTFFGSHNFSKEKKSRGSKDFFHRSGLSSVGYRITVQMYWVFSWRMSQILSWNFSRNDATAVSIFFSHATWVMYAKTCYQELLCLTLG